LRLHRNKKPPLLGGASATTKPTFITPPPYHHKEPLTPENLVYHVGSERRVRFDFTGFYREKVIDPRVNARPTSKNKNNKA
jgi:hypothetical protein